MSITSNNYRETRLLNGWTSFIVYDSPQKNVIVDFRFGLSRPCGSLNAMYALRRQTTSEYLKPSNRSLSNKYCGYFDKDNGREHGLFYETSQFTDPEYYVYESNGIIQELKDNLPMYDPQLLMPNLYKF